MRLSCTCIAVMIFATVAGAIENDNSHDTEQPAPIQPAGDAPQPMSPSKSAAAIKLPAGFRIELVASEPVVTDPSCIAFDEKGRLFVSELHGYNIEGHIDVTELNKTGVLDKQVRRIRWELEGGRIADQAAKLQYGVVKLLRDTDADGIMDTAVVWADDLPPCYGLVPALGGIIVACAPDIVFLADRDGDGKPEIRETLFTGFRTQVLERGINNPRWGLDNWIYVGAGGTGGTITGPRLKRAVVLPHSDFRIKPDGSAIEPVNGRVGTFGMTINDVGDRFPSSGGQPATYALPLPYYYLARNPHVVTPPTNYSSVTYNQGYRISQPHPWRVRRQQEPVWVKFYGARETNSNYLSGGCSNEFYSDTFFPEQYRGNLFYCEPSLNIVHRCVIRRDGAGYVGHRAPTDQRSEFLASTDQWFRPMNLRVGPEGALYIVDMYREIIEDYSAIPRYLQQQYGLNKGSDRGRIWKLLPKETPSRKPDFDLSKRSSVELAKLIDAPIRWHRQTAQRLLIERQDTSVAEQLAAIVKSNSTHNGKIHALYTLAGLERLSPGVVLHCLRDERFSVRLHALRLSERFLATQPTMLDQVVQMVHDEDPSVRLQVAMTLGEAKHDTRILDALENLVELHGDERWMDAAILSSTRNTASDLLVRLLRKASVSQKTERILQPLCATIAAERNGAAIRHVLSLAISLPEHIQLLCIRGVHDGLARGDQPIPESPDGWAVVLKLLDSDSQSVRDAATNIASKVNLTDGTQLRQILRRAAMDALNKSLAIDTRVKSIRILKVDSFDNAARVAKAVLVPRESPELQIAAVEALSASNDQRVGTFLLNRWSSYTPRVRSEVQRTVLSRQIWWPSMLDAIEVGTLKRNDLTDAQRELLVGSVDKRLAKRAHSLFSSPTADAELLRRITRYTNALSTKPDLNAGKRIFAKHCINCHKLEKKDMTSVPVWARS